MKTTIVGTISVQHKRKEKPVKIRSKAGGGFSLPVGREYLECTEMRIIEELVKIEVTIDDEQIVRSLGTKAARSKGGISRVLGGVIRAKVIGRQQVSVRTEPILTSDQHYPDMYERVKETP